MCTFVSKKPNGSCNSIVYNHMNFPFPFPFPFYPVMQLKHPIICRILLSKNSFGIAASSADRISFASFLEANPFHTGNSRFKPSSGNSKCIILKNKRPKIRILHWKYQCETDSRHRKNAEGKKGLDTKGFWQITAGKQHFANGRGVSCTAKTAVVVSTSVQQIPNLLLTAKQKIRMIRQFSV